LVCDIEVSKDLNVTNKTVINRLAALVKNGFVVPNKEMLLVDDVDNKEFLTGLFNSMYDELPAPKPKK